MATMAAEPAAAEPAAAEPAAEQPVAAQAWKPADYKAHGFLKENGDNLYSARVHSKVGDLTADELAAIAAVAKRHGNGTVHLTSRQSLELLGVPGSEAPAVAEELEAAGLDTGSVGTRVRAITACLGSSVCPFGIIDSHGLGMELDRRLFKRAFKGKFKVSVSGCPNNCMKAEENDVGIRGVKQVVVHEDGCVKCGRCVKVCPVSAMSMGEQAAHINYDACIGCGACAKACPKKTISVEARYDLLFAGRFGKQVALGRRLVPPVRTEAQVVAACEAAFAYYDEVAKPGERLSSAVERLGWDGLQAAVTEAVAQA